MRILICLTLLMGLLYSTCKKQTEVLEPAQNAPRIALLITHDISKTYEHIPAPEAEWLHQVADKVAHTGGFLAFALIGTPDSTGQFIRAEFPHMPTYPGTNSTYLQQIAYQNACDSIHHLQMSEADKFVGKCLQHIHNQKRHQHSDINRLLIDAGSYFQEARISDCQPIVFLGTDGIQDVRLENRIDTTLQPELLSPKHTKVYYSKWKNHLVGPGWKHLESNEGLLNEIQSLTQ